MNKKELREAIARLEAKKANLVSKSSTSSSAKELRSIAVDISSVNAEISRYRAELDEIIEANEEVYSRSAAPAGELRSVGSYKMASAGFNPISTYAAGGAIQQLENRAVEEPESIEQRGRTLMEGRAVTIASTGITIPRHTASDILPTFNEVSSIVDAVRQRPLNGGESFKQPYVAGYGTGDYKGEGEAYATAEPTFAYAEIDKTKITAYAEDTEELVRLSPANYDGEVQNGIRIAVRKKLGKEIMIGDGESGHITGIFSDAAEAIDPDTDIEISEIDETTLDTIMCGFGGDEGFGDIATLVLNKLDLKAFITLRTADGQKIHTVVNKGNSGTIDGVPYIINSACKAVSDAATLSGEYCMAYGPMSNYLLAIFSDLEIQRSTDYKFKEGMICHKASMFVGGNVVSKNGFIRVKKL